MFKRILIANRGEIAVRIIRACHELGIECVSVYSTADKDSIHVKLADDSICIGPPPTTKSYLNIENIISAATIKKCDALHPGYGFLAENPQFEKACQQNGITFIGPPSEVISLSGNKSLAVEVMRNHKIPIIAGSEGNVEKLKHALKISKRLGYPVIIKASFGGGGKGMRICNNKEELISLFPIAKSESISSFGKSEVYIEKYIKNPRHIEFQIIADNYGNVVCVGERECSIQRRHQKLIEEAPAPKLSLRTRKIIKEYAVKAAHAINYKNLGTIEFLVDENENFYFIEINSRIQVEHPVTEMVTGLDLIKEQIRIAAGQKNSYIGKDFEFNGNAIEFRINAEDSENNFAPSPGKITDYFLPGGPGIRIDTFIHSNCTVSPFYDSLIAKLIVWGTTREEAIERSIRALNEFIIEGIKTTIPFHKKILLNENFKAGKIHTHFIEEEFNEFIITSAEDIPSKYNLIIVLHLPESKKDEKKEKSVTSAYENFYLYAAAKERRNWLRLRKKTMLYFILSIILLGVGYFYLDETDQVVLNVIREGVFIGGWVFLWEAITNIFIIRHEVKSVMSLYKRLYLSIIRFSYDGPS